VNYLSGKKPVIILIAIVLIVLAVLGGFWIVVKNNNSFSKFKIELPVGELSADGLGIDSSEKYENQKVIMQISLPSEWKINGTVFDDAAGNKVGETGPAVVKDGGLPDEKFFTTDVAEGKKINLLEKYNLSKSGNNIVAYHTIYENGTYESYHYVVDTGEYAFTLKFYGSKDSRRMFDSIAQSVSVGE